jgi:hypothetical protein
MYNLGVFQLGRFIMKNNVLSKYVLCAFVSFCFNSVVGMNSEYNAAFIGNGDGCKLMSVLAYGVGAPAAAIGSPVILSGTSECGNEVQIKMSSFTNAGQPVLFGSDAVVIVVDGTAGGNLAGVANPLLTQAANGARRAEKIVVVEGKTNQGLEDLCKEEGIHCYYVDPESGDGIQYLKNDLIRLGDRRRHDRGIDITGRNARQPGCC